MSINKIIKKITREVKMNIIIKFDFNYARFLRYSEL